MTTAPPTLTAEQIEALGDELDELRGRTIADLGERDANYIRNMIKAQRGLEIAGRGLLFAGFLPPGVDRRHDRPGAVEDPGQHGDRPQRDARPVRLDEGPGAGLQAL